jgi:signal transduction histidine kinase
VIAAALLRARLERLATLDQELRIRLVAASEPGPSLGALQTLADRELPWVVEAVPLDAARLYSGADQRRRIYLTMLLLVFGFLMVGSYITARTVKRELEVARLKSDFVSTVSHEFRSPLTAIRQLSELLQRGRAPTEEKKQEYYALISRESGRLSRLVENLLDFSRMEDGRKQYHFERLETAEWLRDLAPGFGRATVTLSIPPELPPILGDREALTSAVDNLLDNAVKYSPPGAPVFCEAEADGREVTIRVRDGGYGIAPQDRDHVFETFYRGNGEISRKVKGAGVGLSLVRQIVEAHGGTVDFDTRVGEGTVFRIRLKTA